jgi:hypothetical protein
LPNGNVLFRLTDGKAHYLARMGREGSNRNKVVPFPIIDTVSVSPDRRFAILFVPALESKIPDAVDTIAVPLEGGPVRHVCATCSAAWSPDGKYFYLAFVLRSRTDPSGGTLAIPVPSGETLPPLPTGGILSEAQGLAIPGARVIDQGDIIARPYPSTYAYVKTIMHANLFRLPLR